MRKKHWATKWKLYAHQDLNLSPPNIKSCLLKEVIYFDA